MSMELNKDRTLIRTAGRSRRFVQARIQAPAGRSDAQRPPVNLALVIDRSGSMHGAKIRHAIEAACLTVQRLQDRDRFAVVAYDDHIDLVVPSTPATGAARREALERIRRIEARGATDLCEGWLRGCQQIAQSLQQDGTGRCLLLTDGLANRGVTDRNEIVEHAGSLRQRQVVTSTFGIGADFDEHLLARMAAVGGGNFYFIAGADDIPKFIDQETGETLEIVAREVVLEIEADPRCEVRSLNDFPVERSGTLWRIRIGSMTSNQELEPILRIEFPPGEAGAQQDVRIALQSADGVLHAAPQVLRFSYADHAANDAQPRERQIDRPVARLYAARAQREATVRNRDRDFDGARAAIDRCLARIRAYAGEDPELLALVGQLEDARLRYARDMDAMDRKRAYSTASMLVAERSSMGYAKRAARGRGLALLPAADELLPVCRAAARALAGHWRDSVERIDVLDALLRADARTGPFDNVEEIQLATRAYRDHPAHAVRLVLTQRPFADNWFSHWYPGQQTAIATLHGWGDLSQVSAVAYVAQELLLNGLHALSPRFDLHELAHQDTRGCLFDFCGDKRDMEVKLQTMDLCPDCRRTLRRMRIETSLVLELCGVVRDLATGRQAA